MYGALEVCGVLALCRAYGVLGLFAGNGDLPLSGAYGDLLLSGAYGDLALSGTYGVLGLATTYCALCGSGAAGVLGLSALSCPLALSATAGVRGRSASLLPLPPALGIALSAMSASASGLLCPRYLSTRYCVVKAPCMYALRTRSAPPAERAALDSALLGNVCRTIASFICAHLSLPSSALQEEKEGRTAFGSATYSSLLMSPTSVPTNVPA